LRNRKPKIRRSRNRISSLSINLMSKT